MINAGKYNKKITIYSIAESEDTDGFKIKTKTTVLTCYASVKTTSGYTLIINNSDFEKALTNFTIRYPKETITRDMLIEYNEKTYSIEYINNINESNAELELQAKAVVK